MHTSSDARLFAAANLSRPYWLFRTSFANLLRLWSQRLYNYLSSRNDSMNSRISFNSRIKIWSRQLCNRRWVCALQPASISELRIFLFQRTQCSIFYGCMTPMLKFRGSWSNANIYRELKLEPTKIGLLFEENAVVPSQREE